MSELEEGQQTEMERLVRWMNGKVILGILILPALLSRQVISSSGSPLFPGGHGSGAAGWKRERDGKRIW